MEDPGASDFDFTPNRLRQSLRQSVEGSVSKLPRRVIQGLAKDYGIKVSGACFGLPARWCWPGYCFALQRAAAPPAAEAQLCWPARPGARPARRPT